MDLSGFDTEPRRMPADLFLTHLSSGSSFPNSNLTDSLLGNLLDNNAQESVHIRDNVAAAAIGERGTAAHGVKNTCHRAAVVGGSLGGVSAPFELSK